MGLKESLQTVRVEQLNIRPPVTISAGKTVRDAVGAMRSAGLGCVIVTDADGKAAGMFTEAMLRYDLTNSAEILEASVESQMVSRLPWVLPTDSAQMILEAMDEHNIRFIAVLDEQRNVLGITGQKTLMEFIAESFPREIMTQDPTGATVSIQREGA